MLQFLDNGRRGEELPRLDIQGGGDTFQGKERGARDGGGYIRLCNTHFFCYLFLC
nr:MAG TPA: hypothetical protein [Caudoviricetes sp.]